MEKIHNSKKRMPVILTELNEKNWLGIESIENFKDVNVQLNAEPI